MLELRLEKMRRRLTSYSAWQTIVKLVFGKDLMERFRALELLYTWIAHYEGFAAPLTLGKEVERVGK
jgi:hypothetical protein